MNLELARRQMIDQQIRAWDVLDERVLAILAQLRRELFVPAAYRELAFADTGIPLPHEQCMMAPKLEGRVLQALQLETGHEVLEVGTGSGYLAAALSLMAGKVRSLEIFPALSDFARENLRAAGIGGVTVETADAMQLTDRDRYDAIAVTGSLPEYDRRFEQALKVGGRLFVIVGDAPTMEARLVTRTGANQWTSEVLFETVVQPLVHAATPQRFVF